MSARPHLHAEAFALMQYESKDRSVRRTIWNSRDGVTPFGLHVDGTELLHVRWNEDRYAPDHRPDDDDLVFVTNWPSLDAFRDRARNLVAKAPHLAPPPGPELDAFVERLARGFIADVGETGETALVTGAEYRVRLNAVSTR